MVPTILTRFFLKHVINFDYTYDKVTRYTMSSLLVLRLNNEKNVSASCTLRLPQRQVDMCYRK